MEWQKADRVLRLFSVRQSILDKLEPPCSNDHVRRKEVATEDELELMNARWNDLDPTTIPRVEVHQVDPGTSQLYMQWYKQRSILCIGLSLSVTRVRSGIIG